MTEKVEKNIWNLFFSNVVNVVFVSVIIIYLIYCTMYQYYNPAFKITLILPIIYGICIFGCYKFFEKSKKYEVILFCLSFFAYLIWGVFARSPAVSDYEVLINGAKEVVNGTFSALSFDKTNYFYFYNFQVGFVMYLALIMKIFGSRLIVLKFFEAVAMSLSNVLICKIASITYDRKVGIIASLIYSFLLFNIAGSSIINNQHISTFIILLAILMFMKEKKKWYVGSGIMVALSTILRPSSIVFLLGFIVFKIWKMFLDKFQNWKEILVCLILLCISYVSVIKIFDYTVVKMSIVPNSAISANAKYFKFILGLDGKGLYGIPTKNAEQTQVYFDLEKLNFDYDLYNEECKNKISELCLENFRGIFRRVMKKMVSFCGEYDNQIEFASGNIKDSIINDVIIYYGYIQYVSLLCFCLLVVILKKSINKEKYNKEEYNELFKIIFVLFFCAHIFIEVQSRYRYDQYVMISLISAPFLCWIFERYNELKLKYIIKNNE